MQCSCFDKHMILFIFFFMVDTILSFKQNVLRASHRPFEAFLAMISCWVSQREQARSGNAEQWGWNNHSHRL